MLKLLTIAAAVLAIGVTDIRAQTPLKAYVDANGYIDVQKLTCAQHIFLQGVADPGVDSDPFALRA